MNSLESKVVVIKGIVKAPYTDIEILKYKLLELDIFSEFTLSDGNE